MSDRLAEARRSNARLSYLPDHIDPEGAARRVQIFAPGVTGDAVCENCGGEGEDPDSAGPCPECHALGGTNPDETARQPVDHDWHAFFPAN